MKRFSLKQSKIVMSAILLLVVAISFQNCGQSFSVAKLNLNSMSSLSSPVRLSFTGVLNTPQPGYDPEILSIQQNVFGSNMIIQAHRNMAYAITSLKFRDKEFIDANDHGRELQSASAFDSLGECFNPTEAGTSYDGAISDFGSSRTLGYYASGNFLATKTDMAFWLSPGQAYTAQKQCGDIATAHTAVNTTVRGNHILEKSVTIGYAGIENVIDYNVTYRVPEAHKSGTFEALTGYMPQDFHYFYTYQPHTKSLVLVSPSSVKMLNEEQNIPVILSVSDGSSAMGVYSPDLPQASFPAAGYGHMDLRVEGDTTKWNCVFRELDIPANSVYSYRCFVIVGNLEEVKNGMDRLAAKFNQVDSAPSPIPAVVTPSPAVVSSSPIPVDPGLRTPSQIGDTRILRPVYRFFMPATGEHFFTVSSVEGNQASFQYEGVGFNVVASGDAEATNVLHRCLDKFNGMHFVSQALNCEGHIYEGTYGAIYPSPRADSLPLYRLYNGKDHLITNNEAETRAAGYHVEALLGYSPK